MQKDYYNEHYIKTNQTLTGKEKEYLTFKTSQETYCIGINYIKEIKVYNQSMVTSIANTPLHINGFFNLRGVIIPLIDLRILQNKKANFTDTTIIIVIESHTQDKTVGIIVDSVEEVILLDSDSIQQPPLQSTEQQHFVAGLVYLDNSMIISLNIEEIINHTAS